MAFSISPKHIQELPLENLSPEQFLVIAHAVAQQLGWNIGLVSANGLVAYTKFSLSSYGEEIKISINDTGATIKSECTGSQLVDWGKNKANIGSFALKFKELKQTLSEGEIVRKLEELTPNLAETDQDVLNLAPPTTKERITGVLSIFKPVAGYFVTPLLINLNLVIFILMAATGMNIFLPDQESLLQWGANFRPITIDGQWWRLLTSCFLHIGIFHLLMNMYALLYIGLLLEPHLGKTKFISAYLLTGLAASVTSLAWHELTISAGASGAIFGMYGVFLAMLTTNLIEKSARKALLTSIVVFVAYNLLNGMKGGIDNAAHLGGLLSGMVIGYAFVPGLKKKDDPVMDNILIAVLSVVIVIGSAFIYKSITPFDIKQYEKGMNEFASTEQMALQAFTMPDDTPRARLLYELEHRSIYYWNENIRLINDLDRLYLPEPVHQRNKKVLHYCKLRVEHSQVVLRAIAEDTDIYKTQIEGLNRKIEAIVSELTGK